MKDQPVKEPDPAWVAALWKRFDEQELRLTHWISEAMLEMGAVAKGMRVLDLATGRGEPAIPAAHRVGPQGRVTCVDASAPVLAMAQARAENEQLTNLDWHVLDARHADQIASHGTYDVITSRWGLMYMEEPKQALLAARKCATEQAHLVLAVWCEPTRVDYIQFPRDILAREISLPPHDIDNPGPFYYADPEKLDDHCQQTGWRIDAMQELYTPVMEADSPDELIEWASLFGVRRLLEGQPATVVNNWKAAMRAESDRLLRDHRYRLGGTTRIVVAKPIPM